MDGFDRLLGCAGTWEGYNRLQPMPTDPINESASRLIVTPVLRDTFIRFDQSWSWNGEPQSGSSLIGYSRRSSAASVHWIDTWHNGTRVMPLVGEFDANGVLVARGGFPVRDSPDWGWRIEVSVNEERLKIDMFCIEPKDGKAEGWVWSEYRRTGAGGTQ
jgi:hypothetical protein